MKNLVNNIIKENRKPRYIIDILADNSIPPTEKWIRITEEGLMYGMFDDLDKKYRFPTMKMIFDSDSEWEARKKIHTISVIINIIDAIAASRDNLIDFLEVYDGPMEHKARLKVIELGGLLDSKLAYRDDSEHIFDENKKFMFRKSREIIEREYKEDLKKYHAIKKGRLVSLDS